MPGTLAGYGAAMALKDAFSRLTRGARTGPAAHAASDPASDVAAQDEPAPDRDAEPGSVSSPRDVGGRGPVTLADRTAKGGQASPDTNQGRAEPMPATPGEADPSAALPAPELGEMNVGADDPQLASHPLARDRDVPPGGDTAPAGPVNPGVAPHEDRPALDGGSSTGGGSGPERPVQASPGTAQRQPGSMGVSPEEQETDVDSGAARMLPGHPAGSSSPPVQPGDAQGVAVPHVLPAEGTSEEQGIVHGVRTPVDDGAQSPTGEIDLAAPDHVDGSIDRDAQR